MVQRAIVRGMKAFSRCFEPFVSYGPVKKLSEVADEDDKAVLTSTELESQFIVDGKHVPASRTGPESERTTYYSYKLRHVGYRLQCVTTHSGHCVHVSRGERAGTHDLTVYMNNRMELLVGCVDDRETPIITADKGMCHQTVRS